MFENPHKGLMYRMHGYESIVGPVKGVYILLYTCMNQPCYVLFQELMRFENPHKGFTYRMHGYESIVGPVKGVYTKDNTMNKAREHALLVSSRPSYVTILTLGKFV